MNVLVLVIFLVIHGTAQTPVHIGADNTVAVDFNKNENVKGKRENLIRLPDGGLILNDHMRPGRMNSDALELSRPTDVLQTIWVSTMPKDVVAMRVQLSKDQKNWSDWFVVSDETQLKNISTLGRLLRGLGGARYVRYDIAIKADPKLLNRGSIAMLGFVTVD